MIQRRRRRARSLSPFICNHAGIIQKFDQLPMISQNPYARVVICKHNTSRLTRPPPKKNPRCDQTITPMVPARNNRTPIYVVSFSFK